MKLFKVAVTVVALIFFVLIVNVMQYVSYLRKQNLLLTQNFNQLSQKISALEMQMDSKRIVLGENKMLAPGRHKENKQFSTGCVSNIESKGTNAGPGNKGFLLKNGRPQ